MEGRYEIKEECGNSLSSCSPNSNSGEVEIVSSGNNLGNGHYASESKQTVTILYPQSSLPILSASNGELVNLVQLPNVDEVDGSLQLDNSLEYDGGVVLDHNFESSNQIAVVTTDQQDGQLLDTHTTNTDSITYFKTSGVDTLNAGGNSENAILSDQLIHIPPADVVANNHTLTLPLSFVSENGSVSLLNGLSNLPLAISDDNQGEISVPVNIQTSSLISNGESGGKSFILSNITPLTSSREGYTSNENIQKSHLTHISSKNQLKSNSKSFVKFFKTSQVGRPPKIQQNKKKIGYGPSAISAQGVVQEIGNRLVTVLPRPEDLKKLVDNKQLILAVKGSSGYTKVGNKKKVNPYSKSNSNIFKQKEKLKKSYDYSKDIIIDMTLSRENNASTLVIGGPQINYDDDLEDEDFVPKSNYLKYKTKKKRGKRQKRGTYVTSSSGRRPGRPKKVKTIMEGPRGPRVIQTGVNSNSTKLLGHQMSEEHWDSVELALQNASVEAEPNTLKESFSEEITLSEKDIDLRDTACDEIKENGKRKLPPRNRGMKYKKLIQALKKDECEDEDEFGLIEEEESEGSASYESQVQTVPISAKVKGTSGQGKRGRPRKHPSADQSFTSSCVSDVGGTKIIQLNETLKPIHSMNSPSVLIKDEMPGLEEEALQNKLVITFEQPEIGEMVMQHIAVQSPATKNCEIDKGQHHSQEMSPDIVLVSSNEDTIEEENATIFVEENGEYEEGFQCNECGETTQYKRDYIRHLRLKHNLRPYECHHCGKTFTSKASLQYHVSGHVLEKPHRCNHCKVGFDTSNELRFHLLEHGDNGVYDCNHCGKTFANVTALESHFSHSHGLDESKCSKCNKSFQSHEFPSHYSNCLGLPKSYECDICQLQFVSSSGLNRHRKVHNRSSNPETEDSGYRCTTCQASFTFESSLLKHIKFVHNASVNLEMNGSIQDPCLNDNPVIEHLKEKLNEGYAPKTSELYDEPEEAETIERPSNDPFKCGICDESFKDIDILCDHYSSSHTGDQALYCNYCSVGCSHDYQLERHKTIHTKEEKLALFVVDSKDTPYVCSVCGRGFKTAQEIAKHYKIHTQDKHFKCTFCNASFFIKSALDKHILVHTGQRPFVCDICLKSFRQSAALVRHKLWTHRLKNQNKCGMCGKTFFTQNLLLHHLDSHGEKAAELKNRIIEDKKDNESNSLHDSKEIERSKSEDNFSSEDNSKNRICEYCNKECPSLVALLTHKITHKLSASYKCDLCHRTFREKRYLKKHKLTHKGLKIWKCDICKKAFATKLTLIRHSHVHLREALKPDPITCVSENKLDDNLGSSSINTLPNELKCEECNLEFIHKSHYVRHKLLHSGIPLLKCGLCDKMFVHKSDIIRHKVMHSFMFTCNKCGRNFHKRSLYALHMKKHMDAKPFKCDKCNKCFASSGNFKIHQRIHSGEKPYHCNICNYRCSQSGRLLKHKRMHTGEKQATCNLCQKSFSNLESLKSHQRVHTGERPFCCGTCNKSFTNTNSLSQHMRDHVKEEMFKCDQCLHKFRRSEHLEKHKMFHNMQNQFKKNVEMGLDPESNIESPLYMCDICGRVFEKKKYLYTHHNVHSRQKIFSCNVCGKHLASRLALKNHIMIHTGEMPYKCNYCVKEFRSLSNLKRHEKVHYTQETFTCDECGETLYSLEMLNDHKQAHVNLMMMNSEVDNVNNEVNQQLYVFDAVDDSMNESIDPSQQLLVDNSRQQFLVDNSQSLLVFPESTSENYNEITAHNMEQVKLEEEEEEDNAAAAAAAAAAAVAVASAQVAAPVPNVEELEQETQTESYILSGKLAESAVASITEEREIVKPHQCDVCFKYFAKKQYLTKHKYRHREVKPHACDVCGKRFAQKFEVAVHKIKHTGERPYCCEICNKEFRSKVNLINHRMRHTGEYPYLCSVCNKGLSTQLQLERHVSLHTGAHPYRCEICNKGYFQRMSLIKHLEKGHNIQTVDDNFDSTHSLQTPESMEVIEAISTIANMSHLNDEKSAMVNLVRDKNIKEEVGLEVNVETMGMAAMEELGEAQFSVGNEQQEYMLGASQHIDTKFLTSILQQVRVDETVCEGDPDDRNQNNSVTDV